MNLLQRALIEKAGHDNGFEHVLPSSDSDLVLLGSARHAAEARVQAVWPSFMAALVRCQPALPGELARNFPRTLKGDTHFSLAGEAERTRWLRRGIPGPGHD